MKEVVKLKEGDVYHFQWSAEEYEKESHGGALRHCFEGLLVVMDYPVYNDETGEYDNELRLVDTFWDIRGYGNDTTFTLEQAQKRGKLEFYCNLDNIEPIGHGEQVYYDDNDIIELHRQHACDRSCIESYIKKGAKKSKVKMIAVLNEKISEEEHNIEWSKRSVKDYREKLKKVEDGQLDIYI